MNACVSRGKKHEPVSAEYKVCFVIFPDLIVRVYLHRLAIMRSNHFFDLDELSVKIVWKTHFSASLLLRLASRSQWKWDVVEGSVCYTGSLLTLHPGSGLSVWQPVWKRGTWRLLCLSSCGIWIMRASRLWMTRKRRSPSPWSLHFILPTTFRRDVCKCSRAFWYFIWAGVRRITMKDVFCLACCCQMRSFFVHLDKTARGVLYFGSRRALP